MFRKSGNRFSEKNMHKIKESRAHHDSTRSGCALVSPGNELCSKLLAGGHSRLQVPTIHDRKPEASRRHGMAFGVAIFMKRDLHARHAGQLQRVLNGGGRRMAVAASFGTEQHHAVAVAAIDILKLPNTAVIEPDQRINPAVTV